MKENQRAFKRKEWVLFEDNENNSEKKGRRMLKVGIGRKPDEKGETTFIVEDIYEDILDEILTEETDFTVQVDINHFPKLVVFYNGGLVIHNDCLQEAKEEISKALDFVNPSTVIKCFTELRLNQECLKKLGNATKIVVSSVNEITGKDYTSYFIQSVINERINEKHNVIKTSIQNLIHDFSYEELLTSVGGIIQFKECGTCDIEPVNVLMDKCTIAQLENTLKDEIFFRLANGHIRQG